jgi:hypothetical protein
MRVSERPTRNEVADELSGTTVRAGWTAAEFNRRSTRPIAGQDPQRTCTGLLDSLPSR